MLISDEQLDRYRVEGTLIRVIRDEDEKNDVIGFVAAWNDTHVLIRKRNRRVVKLSRSYQYVPRELPRVT